MNADPALGLLRSLAVYYGQPWRTIALHRFYRGLIVPGSLVFDIGAHVGHRSRAMAAAGARVIALEPQPLFADFIDRFVADQNRIRLLRTAVGAEPGQAALRVSSRHPTVSTLSEPWIDAVGASAGFQKVAWDRQHVVPVTTLDALIRAYGRPAFCKIDVEGLEAQILAGLNQPLDCVVFECLAEAKATALACLDHLAALAADYRYNWVVGERHRWARPQWQSEAACRAHIQALPVGARGLDIYARRGPATGP